MYSTADRLAQHVKQFPAMCRGWSSIDDGDARLKHALEETSKLCIGSPSAACFSSTRTARLACKHYLHFASGPLTAFLNETSCHRKIQGMQRDSREHSQNEVEKRLVIFSSVQSISPRPILLAYQKYHLQIQLSFSHFACHHMIHLMQCVSYSESVYDASSNLHKDLPAGRPVRLLLLIEAACVNLSALVRWIGCCGS